MQQNIIDPSIFRAYDIRGIVGKSLTYESFFLLGQALGSVALEKGEEQIAVGFDGRASSPLLAEALSEGILTTGCDVIDVGMVPTPLLYYATFVSSTRSGVMITGSHNPPEYNGCKMMIKGETLAESAISSLYQRILEKRFLQGTGVYHEKEVIQSYLQQILQTVKLIRPLRVVVDAGNGISGMIAPDLYRRLGCEVVSLFCEVDGSFPNHHPDPSQPENLQDLIQAVKEHKADVGIAFDGDGDRLGVVTSQGKIIWPDRQLILFAQSILKKHPAAKIIYDVKCTTHLETLIRESGGEPIMWRTGHSLIKAKLAETKALLAGEMSGHMFFKDRWYGFDDGIYAGARLLEILSEYEKDSDAVFSAIPDSINTPELKVFVTENEKFSLMEKIIEKMKLMQTNLNETYNIMTIDGLRVNFTEGWGLVRPSNTTPCLILRFEALNENRLSKIQDLFRELLLSVQPQLVLPF